MYSEVAPYGYMWSNWTSSLSIVLNLAGLSIESALTLNLLIILGFSVDYCSHVGYKFMVLRGCRKERARKAVLNIGPAVFDGAFSTFIAVSVLGTSSYYISQAFFKVCKTHNLISFST